MNPLSGYRHWIFDMDGTLTVPVHDFAHIRAELEVPQDAPILEFLSKLPPAQAGPRLRRLAELEEHYATLAAPQPGVHQLLEYLSSRDYSLGIVTRNSTKVAQKTLRRARLNHFFPATSIIGHETVPPKPAPDGIHELLVAWRAERGHAVMVGDYVYDLQAGTNAGITTIYYDPEDTNTWSHAANHRVASHHELLALAQ